MLGFIATLSFAWFGMGGPRVISRWKDEYGENTISSTSVKGHYMLKASDGSSAKIFVGDFWRDPNGFHHVDATGHCKTREGYDLEIIDNNGTITYYIKIRRDPPPSEDIILEDGIHLPNNTDSFAYYRNLVGNRPFKYFILDYTGEIVSMPNGQFYELIIKDYLRQ